MKTPEYPHEDVHFCLGLAPEINIDETEYVCIHHIIKRLHVQAMTQLEVGCMILPEAVTDLADLTISGHFTLGIEPYYLTIERKDGVYMIRECKWLETHE